MTTGCTREVLIEFIRNALAETLGDYYLEGYVHGDKLLELLDDPLLSPREKHEADLEKRKAAQTVTADADARRRQEELDTMRKREVERSKAQRALRTITLPTGRKVVLP
jgi:hypothetical protein